MRIKNHIKLGKKENRMSHRIWSGVAFAIIPALILWAGIFELAFGATWYVSKTGTNDGAHGTGTGTDAWLTIQYALTGNRMTQGDTLYIQAGTYAETTTTIAITAGSGTTLVQAYTGNEYAVYIDLPAAESAFLPSSNIKWKYISFTNSTSANQTWFFPIGSIQLTFEDCMFSSASFASSASCVFNLLELDPTVTFERCLIVSVGFVVLNGNTNNANGNFIFKSSIGMVVGFWVRNLSTSSYDVEMYNCTLGPPTGAGSSHIELQHANSTIKAYNNIIMMGHFSGSYGAAFVFLNDASAAAVIADPTKADVKYNVVYTADATIDNISTNTLLLATNYYVPIDKTNKFLNPQFTNYAGGDVSLNAASYVNGRCSTTNRPTSAYAGAAWTAADCGAIANGAIVAAPSLTNGLVSFAGDSLLYASGLGGATNTNYCWQKFATLTGETVSTGTETSVVGLDPNGMVLWAHYIALNYHPATAITDIGLNAVLVGKTVATADAVKGIVDSMDVLADYGIRPIHIGFGSVSGDPPDNTSAQTILASAQSQFTTKGYSYDNLLNRLMYRSDWKDADVYYADLTTDPHVNNTGQLLIATIAANLYYNKWFCWVDTDNVDSLQAGTYYHPLTKAQADAITALNGVRAREKNKILAGIPGNVWSDGPKYYIVP